MKKILTALAITLFAYSAQAAQQTILGGAGVLWGAEKNKLNANFGEVSNRCRFFYG